MRRLRGRQHDGREHDSEHHAAETSGRSRHLVLTTWVAYFFQGIG
jgi:hypothetical protein